METSSILAESVLSSLLDIARRNLARDGSLVPVCVVRFNTGSGIIVDLREIMVADDHVEKQMVMSHLGQKLRSQGKQIVEAVMIVESWFVGGATGDEFAVAPSHHPRRQEAIVVIGRNAANTRNSLIIQPFTRDAANKAVWRQKLVHHNHRQLDESYFVTGLLDYLFVDLEAN